MKICTSIPQAKSRHQESKPLQKFGSKSLHICRGKKGVISSSVKNTFMTSWLVAVMPQSRCQEEDLLT